MGVCQIEDQLFHAKTKLMSIIRILINKKAIINFYLISVDVHLPVLPSISTRKQRSKCNQSLIQLPHKYPLKFQNNNNY